MYVYSYMPFLLTVSGLDMSEVEAIYVTIVGESGTTITKDSVNDPDECELIEGTNTILLKLSQEETASIGQGKARCQCNIITNSGYRVPTKIKTCKFDENLYKEVINEHRNR